MSSNYFRSNTKRRDTASGQAAEVLAQLPQAMSGAVATLFDTVWLGTKSVQVATFGPYVQGAAIGMLLYVFPLIVVMVLIPGGGRILTNYFLVIFWLRSWSIGWALTDRITGVVAAAMWAEVATFAENVAHLFGGLTVITSLLYIVSPLLLYVVIGGGAAALTSLLGFSGIGLPLCISGVPLRIR